MSKVPKVRMNPIQDQVDLLTRRIEAAEKLSRLVLEQLENFELRLKKVERFVRDHTLEAGSPL